jgi:predicted DNA-binding protein
MDTAASCSHNDTTMKNDAIFRLRLPRKELEALKRVAKAHGRPASDYVRSLIGDRVKREYAAMRVREMLDAMKPSRMTEEEAMALADEAKHASRR